MFLAVSHIIDKAYRQKAWKLGSIGNMQRPCQKGFWTFFT